MADCFYHGGSAPGPCPYCKAEDREGRERDSTKDIDFRANAQANAREANLPFGLDPEGKEKK
jgi:hypothetical protein